MVSAIGQFLVVPGTGWVFFELHYGNVLGEEFGASFLRNLAIVDRPCSQCTFSLHALKD